MKNKKTKKYSIMVGGILLIVIVAYFFLGKMGGNSIKIQLSLMLHKVEFTEVAQKFLSQNIIKNIAFNRGYKIINGCSNHPDNLSGGWECFEGGYYKDINQKRVQFNKIDGVLTYLKIPMEEYLYYSDFLHKYGFNGIGKDDKNEFIELSDNLFGLRYSETENFDINQEVQHFKKLNNHWFFFQQDWN